MAAPLKKDQELDLKIDSLAYGGNGVARLNGFVVFVRRGLPGDTVRAAVTKVKRNHAEATALEVVEAGRAARRGAVRPLPGLRRLPLPGPRLRGAARREGSAGRRRARPHRPASQASSSSRSVPAASVFHYRNKLEYSFTTPRTARSRSASTAQAAGTRCSTSSAAGSRPTSATPSATGAKRGRTRSGLPRVRPGDAGGLPPPPRRPRRAQHGPGARRPRHRARRARRRRASSRPCRQFPEVRSVHWAVNDTPGRGDQRPRRDLLWGEEAIEEEILGLRFRVRPERLPADEHGDVRAALLARDREYAGLTGEETVYDLYCGIGTIGLAMARDALTVWGIESSEESIACAVENAELNGLANAAFFAGDVGADVDELRDRAGDSRRRRRRPAARRARRARRSRGSASSQAPRLVYVSCNPTTLAGNAKALVSRPRLHARARAAGGHVPAHAARRVGGALHAMSRVAALYDVHGNLPALEAVLAEVDADTILVGGDVVLGPMPKETLSLLRDRGATFIRGNCDREVAAPGRGSGALDATGPLGARAAGRRGTRLPPRSPASAADGGRRPRRGPLRSTARREVTRRSSRAITPPKRLDPILDGVTQNLVVCGHTHAQFDRLVGDRRLVNAGSVGMAYEGEPGIAALGPPRADGRATPDAVRRRGRGRARPRHRLPGGRRARRRGAPPSAERGGGHGSLRVSRRAPVPVVAPHVIGVREDEPDREER